jgi:hypothetical protein
MTGIPLSNRRGRCVRQASLVAAETRGAGCYLRLCGTLTAGEHTRQSQNGRARARQDHMHGYLSKSDFIVAQSCPTKLYYRKLGYPSTKDEDEFLNLIARSGYVIERIAKLLYPLGQDVGHYGDVQAAAQKTMEALAAQAAVLFEATLISDHKLARVDILVKRRDEFELIEVKAKSYNGTTGAGSSGGGRLVGPEWQEPLQDVTFQVCVLQEMFPNARIRPFLVMPDQSKSTGIDLLPSLFRFVYPENGDEDLGSDFTRMAVDYVGDVRDLRRNHFLTKVDVTAEVENLKPGVRSKIAEYVASLVPELRRIEPSISAHCRDCEYRTSEQNERDGFWECWGELADVTPHIFDMYSVSRIGGRDSLVNELVQQRKVSLFDIPRERLVTRDGRVGALNRRQIIQLEHSRSNTEWMSDELRTILHSFEYPLHFIDFETSVLAVPCRSGLHPYEHIAFQWSCHTLRQPEGELEHAEWLDLESYFPNFYFAESLMEHVGTSGTLFTWATHEKTTLRRILEQMDEYRYRNPGLRDRLEAILGLGQDRDSPLVDMHVLTLKHYFHPLMKGKTSVKAVVDAVWKTDLSLRARWPEYVKEADGEILSPYESLPALTVGGRDFAITEGTGATYAYQSALYGWGRADGLSPEAWRRLLLQYCKLDTLAMVMIWHHWWRNGPS